MNENAKRWIDALRSGEYSKTTDQLMRTTEGRSSSFCCLGVACEISCLGTWELGRAGSSRVTYAVEDHYSFEELPLPVRQWLGLTSPDGVLTIDGNRTSLAELNDNGVPFSDIADIIEKNADQLFAGDAP